MAAAIKNLSLTSRMLTVGEIADHLRVHRSTVYRMLKNSDIPRIRIGSDWRFDADAVQHWLNKGGSAK